MKKITMAFLTFCTLFYACKSSGTLTAIQPKNGSISLPANGEYRMWRNIAHPAFNITLINNATNQSCEVYKVSANGNEKWVSPSLQAGKLLTITVPTNGHLFFKNFNPNQLIIEYTIAQ